MKRRRRKNMNGLQIHWLGYRFFFEQVFYLNVFIVLFILNSTRIRSKNRKQYHFIAILKMHKIF